LSDQLQQQYQSSAKTWRVLQDSNLHPEVFTPRVMVP
jgi:hypothetical protein